MNKALILIFFLFSVSALKAQVPVVNLDISTGKIDSILPFDQPFNIVINGIKDDVKYNSINITFYPIKSPKKSDTLIYTIDDLINMRESPAYKINIDKPNDNTVIGAPFNLKHSTNYYVQIGEQMSRKLNKKEHEILKLKIKQNLKIDTLKFQYINTYIGLSKDNKELQPFSELFANLFKQVTENIKSIENKEILFSDSILYKIKSDENDLNSTIADIGNRRNSIQKIVENIYKRLSSLKEYKIQDKELKTHLDTLRKYGIDKSFTDSTFKFSEEEISKDGIDSISVLQKVVKRLFETNELLVKNEAELEVKLSQYYATILNDLLLKYVTVLSVVQPTYYSSLTKEAKRFYTLDLGYLYSSYLNDLYPTLTISFSIRPINKDVPLRSYKGWDCFWARTNVFFGTTISSVSEEGKRKGFWNDKAILAGAGFKVLPFLKIGVGAMGFYREDKNPAINQYNFFVTPFYNASIDIDVAKTLKILLNET